MMLKRTLCVMLAVLMTSAFANAKNLESGIQSGDRIGAFYVVKVAGAEKDGVPEGKELCYRCKLGRRPVVAVFARTADKELASLVHELDKVVAENSEKKMASFVNLLGADKEALDKSAKQLIKESKAEHIAVVVPVDSKNGPENLKIAKDADVTVMIYRKGIVAVNQAFAKGDLDEDAIAKVIKATSEILN